MTVVVTRPRDEADRWVARLQAHGIAARAIPLIDIAAAPQAQPLQNARARLAQYAAVMFVSANAVRHFFADASGAQFPARAWAPGPGTQAALLEAGVPLERIDAPAADAQQFDSEALWGAIAGQLRPGQRVLVVRGGDSLGQASGREWMSEQLVRSGIAVDAVVAYVRRAPVWSTADAAEARAESASTWLLSSSEAIGNLLALLPGQQWQAASAITTHPRITQAARAAGFGAVQACRPAFDEVLACLQSAR